MSVSYGRRLLFPPFVLFVSLCALCGDQSGSIPFRTETKEKTGGSPAAWCDQERKSTPPLRKPFLPFCEPHLSMQEKQNNSKPRRKNYFIQRLVSRGDRDTMPRFRPHFSEKNKITAARAKRIWRFPIGTSLFFSRKDGAVQKKTKECHPRRRPTIFDPFFVRIFALVRGGLVVRVPKGWRPSSHKEIKKRKRRDHSGEAGSDIAHKHSQSAEASGEGALLLCGDPSRAFAAPCKMTRKEGM
jgi:hypothetical protein